MLSVVVNDEYSFGGVGAAVLRLGLLRKRENTGCPKKKSLEANISGFQGPFGQSWTSLENFMFPAFI